MRKLALILVVLCAGGIVLWQASQSAKAESGLVPEGTWYLVGETFPGSAASQFSLVVTLTRDGRFVAMDQGDLTPRSGLSTTSLGSWTRSGPASIATTSLEFLYDGDGNLTSMQKTIARSTLIDSDTLEGELSVAIYPATQLGVDPDGNPVAIIETNPTMDDPAFVLGPLAFSGSRLRVE